MQDHTLLAKPGMSSIIGNSLEKTDYTGKSAMHYAVKHGHLDIVQLLLSAGVKIKDPLYMWR
jgi:hypothetical protein